MTWSQPCWQSHTMNVWYRILFVSLEMMRAVLLVVDIRLGWAFKPHWCGTLHLNINLIYATEKNKKNIKLSVVHIYYFVIFMILNFYKCALNSSGKTLRNRKKMPYIRWKMYPTTEKSILRKHISIINALDFFLYNFFVIS